MLGSGRRRGMVRCRSGGTSRRRGRGRGLGQSRSGMSRRWTRHCGAGILRGPASRSEGVSKKNFAALFCFVYLCLAVFCYFAYLCFVTYLCVAVLCYYGCYHFNYIWMPPLGYIMEYIKLSLFVQENLQFQSYHLRRYGLVPVIIRIESEIFLVSFLWTNTVLKSNNEG